MTPELVLLLAQIAAATLPLAAAGIRSVLHLLHIDHRTVAGQTADALDDAGRAAATLKDVLNGVQHGDPNLDPPT